MTTVRQAIKDRGRARRFWAGLDSRSKWELGDALVLGDLDHLEWFGRRESAAFMNELDRERMHWEEARE